MTRLRPIVDADVVRLRADIKAAGLVGVRVKRFKCAVRVCDVAADRLDDLRDVLVLAGFAGPGGVDLAGRDWRHAVSGALPNGGGAFVYKIG